MPFLMALPRASVDGWHAFLLCAADILAPLTHLLGDEQDKPLSRRRGEPPGLPLLDALLLHVCAAAVALGDETGSAGEGSRGQATEGAYASTAGAEAAWSVALSSRVLPSLVSQHAADRCSAVWGSLPAPDLEAVCRYLARRAAACPPPSPVAALDSYGRASGAHAVKAQEDHLGHLAAQAAVCGHGRLLAAVAASVAVGTSRASLVPGGEESGWCAPDIMLKSGLVAAVAHGLASLLHALPPSSAPPAARSTGGPHQPSDAHEAAARKLAAAAEAGADCLLVMSAVSADIASYVARLPHFASSPRPAQARAAGGALAAAALTSSQRVALDLIRIVHGRSGRAASDGGGCGGDGGEAAAVAAGAKEVLQAWLSAILASCLLRSEHDACLHVHVSPAAGADAAPAAAKLKPDSAPALHMLLLLQAVVVAGEARRRAFSKVPALETVLKEAQVQVSSTIRAVQERIACLQVSRAWRLFWLGASRGRSSCASGRLMLGRASGVV